MNCGNKKVSTNSKIANFPFQVFLIFKDISMWGGNAAFIDILVKAKSLQKVTQKLKENNIEYELLIPDVQKAIDEENPPMLEEEETDDRQG